MECRACYGFSSVDGERDATNIYYRAIFQIIPLVAFEGVFDAVNICGSGVFRGCGKQITGFVLNFVAYYVIGLPLGFFMVRRGFNAGRLLCSILRFWVFRS